MDYLVIGAGPAGLQLGWFLQQAGRDYLILEAGTTPGTFYRTFPRHRQMISINKPHTGWDDPELNLRMDWNSLLSDNPDLLFTRYTDRYFPDADDYVRYLTDYATTCELNVEYGTRVTRIARARRGIGSRDGDDRSAEGGFVVTDQHGRELRAKRVVAATGFGRPHLPPIPGIEETEEYGEVSIDPDDFTDQRVLIVGKGNAAFEVADNLVERAAVIHLIGPSSVKFAWRTHFIGHLRAVNNNFLDTYSLKSQNMVLDATLHRIERAGSELVATLTYARRDRTARLAYDRVITCTGFRMDTSIFDPGCRPELTINDRFPALTSAWESVNVPDLYFAGTLTQSRDFKKHTSAFIHGFRYGVRALQRILDRRYEGTGWPWRSVPAEPVALTDAILGRVNRSSGLWQQYAFLCDVVGFSPGGAARYHEEVPVDHVLDGGFGATGPFLTVTLEYGAGHDTIDPFDVEIGRRWEAEHEEDRYLHPVIRHYRDGELISVLPLPEDLCNDWSGEASHREPLIRFLARVGAGGEAVAEDEAATDTPDGSRTELLPEPRRPVTTVDPLSAVNLRELEDAARTVLDPVRYDYFAGGAQDEVTVRANEASFGRLTLVPRILRGAGPPRLDVTVLGADMTMPVLLAPTAFHQLAHPDAERATARAAAAAGVTMVVAMLSTVAVEDIATEARKVVGVTEPTLWFQLYVQPDLAFTEAIVRRAEAAGCQALVVTVDSSALGRRERDDRNDFHDLPPGLRCENLRELPDGEGKPATGHVRQVVLSPEISWSHLDWLRETTDLPILLKGVLHPHDARLAVDRGVDGLVVSNHGGRQLDTTPATVDQLPSIAEAVESRVPVLVDGGIRRGTDVVKALALGADAVGIGRPALWGLAAGGEKGVARVLELLRTELENALALCGYDSPRAVRAAGRDIVGRRPEPPERPEPSGSDGVAAVVPDHQDREEGTHR